MIVTSRPASASPETEELSGSPLLLDGLIEFNRQKWGVIPQRVRLTNEESGVPNIEAVYYTDRRGRIEHPRIGPYIPVAFTPTPTKSRARLDRQWVEVAGLLAKDMRVRGVTGAVPLSPDVTDVRPWQWESFQTDVRFTYYLDFPYDEGLLDPAVRRQFAKASRNGFRVERVSEMGNVADCLRETQNRKDFDTGVDASDLTLLREFIGDDHLRTYVCYAPDGEPACGGAILHRSGARALYWVFGTKTKFMPSGATQLAIRYIVDDLYASGATGLDFLGAQLPSVAAMKATWGSRLVPYYRVDGGRLRAIAKNARDYWSFRRMGS